MPRHSKRATALLKDTGWTQMTGSGAKAAAAVYTGSYTAVDFSALDVGNIGLNALSTQVAARTVLAAAQSARIRSLEAALFNCGILSA